jgi:hypothetical protein
MRALSVQIVLGLLSAIVLAGRVVVAAPGGEVIVTDSGKHMSPATYECTPGHPIEKHTISLDSGKVRYGFGYSGCTDPSHGDKRPNAEGNFGMPEPVPDNWYWGGFIQVLVNGTDAVGYRVTDMRVTERGARGAFQVIWAHPDAQVGLRLMMLPGGNHVMADLRWWPKAGATVKTVSVRLTCYPSFFTAARHRKGERHCRTPRTDLSEPKTLELVPAQDTYLYYYDNVFDVAKGEGDGPCAALISPASVQGGRVNIGDYAVLTDIDLKPEAGQARLGFYDFTGLTNAAADAYLKAHAAGDLTQLEQTDFRPPAANGLDADALKSEATKLLADAAEDGKALQPQVEGLLSQLAALKPKAGAGDWGAEADLADEVESSTDLFWKLRAFAVLNRPE